MDLGNHRKPYFLNLSINHDFYFGEKNTKAMIVPHAGSEFINQLLTYGFNNINKFRRVLLLSTNHIDSNNYSHSSNKVPNTIVNDDFFNNEHSYLSILPYIQRFDSIIMVNWFI